MNAPAAERYRGHTGAAEALLEEATELAKGTRCHLAKTYAGMAQAHATLAANALAELVHTPLRLVMTDVSTESDTAYSAPDLTRIVTTSELARIIDRNGGMDR